MSSIKYAFLSLLAREPLSGYDIKQQLNGRVSFFYKISNNQLYPVLSKLEEEGLVRVKSYEQEGSRPARKVYEITDQGLEILKAWVVEPESSGTWDDFMLKQYNSWLLPPETMMQLLENRRREHEARLETYTLKISEFRKEQELFSNEHPLFSSIAVLEMGIQLERGYAEWCTRMLECYRQDAI